VLEQLRDNRLFRPDAIYTGAVNAKYVPMAQR
jgi:citrate synthase